MWDTGCSLPGLITLAKFEEWKERFGMKLKHEKWYEKGKEISGVFAGNPVMMMGTVVFEFSHGGRSFDLEFGVLKGGDTGSADVIVGNYVLRNDRYDGAVDVGAGVVRRMPPANATFVVVWRVLIFSKFYLALASAVGLVGAQRAYGPLITSCEAGYLRAGRQAGRAKCFTLLGF